MPSPWSGGASTRSTSTPRRRLPPNKLPWPRCAPRSRSGRRTSRPSSGGCNSRRGSWSSGGSPRSSARPTSTSARAAWTSARRPWTSARRTWSSARPRCRSWLGASRSRQRRRPSRVPPTWTSSCRCLPSSGAPSFARRPAWQSGGGLKGNSQSSAGGSPRSGRAPSGTGRRRRRRRTWPARRPCALASQSWPSARWAKRTSRARWAGAAQTQSSRPAPWSSARPASGNAKPKWPSGS
mmetsp:Transcript_5388/g.16667  ORF Transcript_5388/g.16667 Transcript_5388/m.16667 type:complete len:238 (-) Transcript_5388:289-1002(-)